METTLITFQRFNDSELARQLTDLLTTNNILFEVENTSLSFDPSFSNSELNNEIRVRLNPSDFEKANKLLEDISRQQLSSISKDHYLFNFSDDELIDVIIKSDEWSHLDVQLAHQILKEKGKGLDEATIEKMKSKWQEELSKPEKSEKIWIIFGYITAILGGPVAVFIGWHLATYRKPIANGELNYKYLNHYLCYLLLLKLQKFITWPMNFAKNLKKLLHQDFWVIRLNENQ